MLQRVILVICFFILLNLSPAEEPIYIYGIHSWGFGANGLMNGKRGWSVEVINTDSFPWDPTPSDIQNVANENFEVIIRINKTFGETVPTNSSLWDSFAQQCADKVALYKDNCHIWIIGNEMNADFEGNIPVGDYIQVYTRCRERIKTVQPEAKVIVAALAPWNASQTGVGPYPSNRQWLNYMYELVNTLNDDTDGYAIHAYGGRGGDSDPRDDDEMAFGVFKRWMEIIDGNPYAASKPVYLTEMNHAADGQGSTPGYPLYPYPDGYIQLLYETIDDWNISHAHKIQCACWFSYANGGFPGYNITLNSLMSGDFNETTATTNYYNRVMSTPPAMWTFYE
jgi:hypothetical protein